MEENNMLNDVQSIEDLHSSMVGDVIESNPTDDLDSTTNEETEEVEGSNESLSNDDVEEGLELDEVLKAYGIDGKFTYGEDEVEYSDLSDTDKVEVLQHLLADNIDKLNNQSNPDITDYEASVINYMRENGLGLDEIVQEAVRQALSESNVESPTSINDYTDEQVFMLDYLNKLGVDYNELSDEEKVSINEELEEQLEAAKKSKSFSKRMQNIKDEYVNKIMESELAETERRAKEAEIESARFEQEFVTKAYGIKNIGPIELEDTDKEFVYNKFLKVDENGVNEFVKEMFSTPEQVFRTIYNAYKAEENMKAIVDHYEKEIKKAVANAKKEVLDGGKFPSTPIKRDGAGSKPVSKQSTDGLMSINDAYRSLI